MDVTIRSVDGWWCVLWDDHGTIEEKVRTTIEDALRATALAMPLGEAFILPFDHVSDPLPARWMIRISALTRGRMKAALAVAAVVLEAYGAGE